MLYFYIRYAVSYCDLEEIMAERGANVDHSTSPFHRPAFEALHSTATKLARIETAHMIPRPTRSNRGFTAFQPFVVLAA